MKKNLICLFITIILFCSIFTVSCGKDECVHDYDYIVVKQATCEEKGELEGRCVECGDKIYKNLAILDHDFINGICADCGATEKEDVNDDVNSGWTLATVLEKAKIFNKDLQTEQEYISSISELEIEISINAVGWLLVEYSNSSYSAVLCDVDRISYNISAGKTDNLFGIYIEDNCLNVIYVDGTMEKVGALIEEPQTENLISSFLINKNNEFVVFYSDNTARKFGTVSVHVEDTSSNSILYRKNNNGYEVVGLLDDSITDLVIPATHRGKHVSSIDRDAFLNCDALEKIVIGDNVRVIGYRSFAACDNLTEVVLGASVTEIEMGAFANCSNLNTIRFNKAINKIGDMAFYGTVLYDIMYEGTAFEWGNVDIGSHNSSLNNATWHYNELISK